MSNERYHPMLETAELIEHDGVMCIPLEEANNLLFALQSRHDGMRGMFEKVADNADRLVHEIDAIRGVCARQARFLAMHGSDDHKTKNEAILKVVATLLSIDEAFAKGGSGLDEIPF